MRLDQEISQFLQVYYSLSSYQSRRVNADRDNEVLLYYYGFRDARWPTLAETAEACQVGGTHSRERVRQILAEFRNMAKLADFPGLVQAAKLLAQRPGWTTAAYLAELAARNLYAADGNPRGLLNFMQDFGLAREYNLYTPELDPSPRTLPPGGFQNEFLLSGALLEQLAAYWKRLRQTAADAGIARLSILLKDADCAEADPDLLVALIHAHNLWLLAVCRRE
jgi:hypothetical protein